MRILIDTNTYTAAAKGDPAAVQVLRTADEIYIPFVVLAELRAGFAAGTVGRRNESLLVEFLNSPRVSSLFADEQTTHHYARIYAELRKLGTPVPTHDLWIAALAVQHDLVVFSRDEHFSRIVQIVVKF